MLLNKRFTFLARFEREQNRVTKSQNRNYQKSVYLFKNVELKEDNSFFIPHIWINQTKEILLLGKLFKYDIIEFDARVVEYEPNKYTLMNPNKIKLFNRFSRGKKTESKLIKKIDSLVNKHGYTKREASNVVFKKTTNI